MDCVSKYRVVVRRTFIELACDDPPGPLRGNRLRSYSDTAIQLRHHIMEDGQAKTTCASLVARCPCLSDVSTDETDGESLVSVSSMKYSSDEDAMCDCSPGPRAIHRLDPWTQAEAAVRSNTTSRQPTTLVLKQLPLAYSHWKVLDLLHKLGLSMLCDFIYAPTNYKTRAIFGYCFANFVDHPAAVAAMQKLCAAKQHSLLESSVEILWSEPHQGLAVLVERYRNSPMMHQMVEDDVRPALLRRGVRIPFPPPTSIIAPPSGYLRHQRVARQASAGAHT